MPIAYLFKYSRTEARRPPRRGEISAPERRSYSVSLAN